MEVIVHGFDWPDRLVVGTVGPPGSRTFFLQARTATQLVSVALEKQQSAALAERIDEILDQLMSQEGNPFSVPDTAPEGLRDTAPLEQPLQEQFRVGMLSLGWDPSKAQLVIEAFPLTESADEDLVSIDMEPDEILQVRIPVGTARAFAKRTREVIGAGRPLCPLCGEPMDPSGHVCSWPDGFR